MKRSQSSALRVGFYARYIPHYRVGVMEALQRLEGLDVVMNAPPPPANQFVEGPGRQTLFAIKKIKEYSLPLQGTRNQITFHPRSLWDMLVGRYDVYVMANDILRLDVWLGLLLKPITGARICLWGHGVSRPQTRIRVWLRHVLMRMADAAVFYTNTARRFWMKRGFSGTRLFVAPNALDTVNIENVISKHSARKQGAFREKHGIDGRLPVLFVGRLQARKRPDVLLRAMEVVCKQLPTAKVIFIGDGPLRKELGEIAQSRHLEQYVSFMGAVYDEYELAQWFMAARVVVIPAAAGLAIQHAFTYKTPVIIGDNYESHGPEADLITDGQTGWICRDDDPEDMARCILSALTNTVLMEQMGNNAYKMITTEYNLCNMVRRLGCAIRYAAGLGLGEEDGEYSASQCSNAGL